MKAVGGGEERTALAIYIENLMGLPEKDSAHGAFLLSASSQSVNQAVQVLDDLRRYHKIYKTNPFSYLQKGMPLHSTRPWLMKAFFDAYTGLEKLALLVREIGWSNLRVLKQQSCRVNYYLTPFGYNYGYFVWHYTRNGISYW